MAEDSKVPGKKDKKKKKDGPSTKTILIYTGLLIALIGFFLLIAFMSGAFDDVGSSSANVNSFEALVEIEQYNREFEEETYVARYGFYSVHVH